MVVMPPAVPASASQPSTAGLRAISVITSPAPPATKPGTPTFRVLRNSEPRHSWNPFVIDLIVNT